jgi:low affinity Fe/Cu permease
LTENKNESNILENCNVRRASVRPSAYVSSLRCNHRGLGPNGPNLPLFSDTWQLIINTGTTIVTFLMVFVIQNTQNRDGAALQTKLDELIRSSHAHNRFIGIEHLTDEEIEAHRQSCAALAKKATERAIARHHRSVAVHHK